MNDKKICSKCGEEKKLERFYNSSASKDGKQSRCKTCDDIARKEYYLTNEQSKEKRAARLHKWKMKKYNLTPEAYQELVNKQEGKCAICGGEQQGRFKNLAVDHDHHTGYIRGLLCNSCNRGLGLLGDSVESLEKALRYLKKEIH